ncbi:MULTISPECIES: TIGR04282 family arsenosugar biosynthesis glycosyltransferase [unclassified Frankia]
MAKEPVPGRVKTRLTPPLRPDQAAAVAAAALADTLAAVEELTRLPGFDALCPVLVLDGAVGPWLETSFGRIPAGRIAAGRIAIEVMPQVSGPFDVRLAAAFDAGSEPILLIGMDTPQVTAALLASACHALHATDAVFGPAADGGWWALGLTTPDGDLLRGVPTSRPDTGARQRARLSEAGLTVTTLPTVRDVDTMADADAVARLVPGGRFAAALRATQGDRITAGRATAC